jgi:hypothetical protein
MLLIYIYRNEVHKVGDIINEVVLNKNGVTYVPFVADMMLWVFKV